MQRWRPAYVALGSNLDDPAAQLREAFGRLSQLPDTLFLSRSRTWGSRPLGPPDQPDYVNAVAGLLTRLGPRELLAGLKAIESAMGRVQPAVRWGARVIDLDLVALGSEQVDESGLTLPHPGVHERDFVLYPLAELAPELWLPGKGRVRTLAARVENRGLVALAE